MSTGYATYVVGADSFFDKDLLSTFTRNFKWTVMRASYSSNWRVLHVDGFEGYSYLPKPKGRLIHFNFETREHNQ